MLHRVRRRGIGKREKNKRAKMSRTKNVRTNPFCQKYGRTIRVSTGLAVMFVSSVESQSTKSEIVLSQVLKVSTIVLQLSLVLRISRVPLLVPPVGNIQIIFMHFSLDRIREVILICPLVCFKFINYMFILC